MAEAELEKTVLRAPISGTIIRKNLRVDVRVLDVLIDIDEAPGEPIELPLGLRVNVSFLE